MRGSAAAAAAVMLCGCFGDPVVLGPIAPVFQQAAVEANPNNVLSAVARARVSRADSVAVRYHLAGAASSLDSVTAAVAVEGDSAIVPVLGLLPERRYVLQPVATGPGGRITGDSILFETGSLPSDLPAFVAGGPDPTPGFVVFAAGRYGIAVDNGGRIVWYRRFDTGPGLNFMPQSTGRYVARPTTPDPADRDPWVEVDPLGTVTRTLGCLNGLQARFHDLIVEADGSYWAMCDETRTMDLTAIGGQASARVTGTALQHVSASGTLQFSWTPFDHFSVADLPLNERNGPSVNWTHGNALAMAPDGNILVSFRSLGEITKINPTTGAIIWRLGGPRNGFAFIGTPTPAFVRQHGARVAASGELLLLDNVGNPLESRAERYAIDEGAYTARLISSYGSVPGVVTLIGGNVQPLPAGRTLVSFGTEGRVEEFDAAGRVMWRIEGHAGYVFHAERIRSLYAPGVAAPPE